MLCLSKSNKTSYPVMAKLPPIDFRRKRQISTFLPLTHTSPDHVNFIQASRNLPSTSNIPKTKPTCRFTTREEAAPCPVEVEYPASKETTTPYCGVQTAVPFVAVSRGNNNWQRFQVIPQGRVDSGRNGTETQGTDPPACCSVNFALPSGSDIAEYETKMPQKHTYGKQVPLSTSSQRENSASRATLVAPLKPSSEFSGNARMKSEYVPTISEQTAEKATLSAGNKRLLCRRQDASGPRFPPSSIEVATDEIYAFPQQARTRANTHRQQQHLRLYSNNPCPETSRAAFEAEDGRYPTLPLPPTEIGRQRRICVVDTVQNEDNRWNRHTPVCLATDITIRNKEHALPPSRIGRQRRSCVVEPVQNEDNRRNRRIAVCLATDTTTRDRELARVMIKRF